MVSPWFHPPKSRMVIVSTCRWWTSSPLKAIFCLLFGSCTKPGWWFWINIFFVFTPKLGENFHPFWLSHIFQAFFFQPATRNQFFTFSRFVDSYFFQMLSSRVESCNGGLRGSCPIFWGKNPTSFLGLGVLQMMVEDLRRFSTWCWYQKRDMIKFQETPLIPSFLRSNVFFGIVSSPEDRLREAIPDIYLLTDVICGYPTETEEAADVPSR